MGTIKKCTSCWKVPQTLEMPGFFCFCAAAGRVRKASTIATARAVFRNCCRRFIGILLRGATDGESFCVLPGLVAAAENGQSVLGSVSESVRTLLGQNRTGRRVLGP